VGGGARSELWTRIVTDVTRRPVRVCADAEWSAGGAAELAWSFLDGAEAGVRAVPEPAGRDLTPDPGAAEVYDALAAAHRGIYPALRGVFADLAVATAAMRR
jgi:xylulokinase